MFAKFSQRFLGSICGQTKQRWQVELVKLQLKKAQQNTCWGNCKNDSKYPDKLLSGTYFIRFPKPGNVKQSMTQWEKDQENVKTGKAKK